MNIKVKRIKETATLPTRGSDYAAGYDLYSAERDCVFIPAHSTTKIGTGLAIEIPHGYFGAIFAISGMATKRGVRPANCVGVCDEDYRGEYIVALHNDTNEDVVVLPHERIAQLVIMPYLTVEFEEVDDLSETTRGEGGFGSTD